jgi:hypothetical protein
MIRYALLCKCGHEFESWFQSSLAYESQHKRKLVSCPVCDSTKVEKAIMAPRIVSKIKTNAPTPAPQTTENNSATTQLVMAPQERELLTKLKELRDHVTKNADNVGKQFPDEARKIHYGDSEHRAIYGEATPAETHSLIEEGIDVLPLPILPEDRN